MIAVPPKAEQERIAQALSDMDELISSLEKLIEKKKAIREGAMQELISKKVPLRAVCNEEFEYKIGCIGDFYGGLTGKSKADFGHGSSHYITFLNVLTNAIIDTSSLANVNIGEGEKQNPVQRGDLFFNTSSETPDEVGMCAVLMEDLQDCYLNSFCFGFRLKEPKIDPLYFSYYFNSTEGRKIMSILAQGATRYNLSKSNFAEMVIQLPSLDKQKEIVSIIYDMDFEIQSLQSKLDKYRQIKSGMMDELLTGKVRLV